MRVKYRAISNIFFFVFFFINENSLLSKTAWHIFRETGGWGGVQCTITGPRPLPDQMRESLSQKELLRTSADVYTYNPPASSVSDGGTEKV